MRARMGAAACIFLTYKVCITLEQSADITSNCLPNETSEPKCIKTAYIKTRIRRPVEEVIPNMEVMLNKIEAQEKTVRQILDKTKYTIDVFQREYRWERRHIEQLLSDLTTRFLARAKLLE